MRKISNDVKLNLNVPNIVIILWLIEFKCSQQMTIKVFVAMSTTNSYMVHKNYMCIYIHTLYTHAHTITHISL